MKKTGILTLSAAQNYGAVLQAYSLCEYLNKNYSDTEIINFVPRFISESKSKHFFFTIDKSNILSKIRLFFASMVGWPMTMVRYYRFNEFRKKYCRYSDVCYKDAYTDDNYDIYVVGSDQVFNLKLTKNDDNFFLTNVKSKKISYAASLGVSVLSFEEADILKKNLASFAAVSIREKTGRKLVSELLGKEVFQHIDPVFLHTKDEWSKLARERLIKKQYILLYTFRGFDKACALAEKINSKYRIINITHSPRRKKGNAVSFRTAGPREFLSLIKYAAYIITDSFHGMAFSILFEKRFTVIPFEGTSSRMEDLLKEIELDNRILYGEVGETDTINYSEIDYYIQEERRRTREYFDRIYK